MLIVELGERSPVDAAKVASRRIAPGEATEQSLDGVDGIELIEISFAKFGDGRGFTMARRLRGEHGFRGELRAVGDLLPDQAMFLKRCGFDSVEAANAKRAQQFRQALGTFNYAYQLAEDDLPVVQSLRRTRGK